MKTAYKCKLPQNLSHSIGLERIRAALASAPQLEDLRLIFSDGDWQATQFRRSLRDRKPYAVFVASYKPPGKSGFTGSKEMVERGHYDEAWELTINPTLRELRALARRLLISEGLPAVASWLLQAHSRSGDSRYRKLELIFDADNETLDRREHVGA